jgi:uncharacterized protein YecT (DUF1311 family)
MNKAKQAAALLVLALGVQGCGKLEQQSKTGASKCADVETYESLKRIVFNSSRSSTTDDPLLLNDWSRTFSVSVELPLLQSVDTVVSRTNCTGRLVLTIPQPDQSKFGGETALKADISYFIQPSADGSGDIVSAEGAEYLIGKIVAANRKSLSDAANRRIEAENLAAQERATEVAKIGGPQTVRTYNPSFDCGQSLNNVERMICQNEGLAGQDRQLSADFKLKLMSYEGDQKQRLLSMQRDNLSRRAACADVECLESWYYENSEWVSSIN